MTQQRGRAPTRGQAAPVATHVSLDANPNDQLTFMMDDIRLVIRDVAKKPNVTSLSLQGSYIPARSMALLANYLSTNRNIKTLNLAQCSLGDDTALILLKAFVTQPGSRPSSGVTSLDLSFNYLSDNFCAHVKTYCTRLSLRRLNVGFNPITMRGLSSLLGVGSVLTAVDARYCTLIPPTPHTVSILKSQLSSRPNLRHLCLDGVGFKKSEFLEMRKHLERHGLQDLVEVGMGRAAGAQPTVANILTETYKARNGGQDAPGFEAKEAEEKQGDRSEEQNGAEERKTPPPAEEKKEEQSETNNQDEAPVEEEKKEEEGAETDKPAAQGEDSKGSEKKEEAEPSKEQKTPPPAEKAEERKEEQTETDKPDEEERKEEGAETDKPPAEGEDSNSSEKKEATPPPEDQPPNEEDPVENKQQQNGEEKEAKKQEDGEGSPEGDGSPSRHRAADAAIVAEIAKVDGAIVAVRPKLALSAFDRRRRPRSVSRSAQVKEVEPNDGPVMSTSGRSASVSSYYSATRSRSRGMGDLDGAGNGEPGSPTTTKKQQHHDPSSLMSLMPTIQKSRGHSCSAPPTSSRRGENTKQDEDSFSEQKESNGEPATENGSGDAEEEPYVAPQQPSVVKRVAGRSRSAGSSRAPSVTGRSQASGSAARSNYAPVASSFGGSGKDESTDDVKNQLRRGKLARMFLDKCSADDSQAVQILNLQDVESLQAGGGKDVDCPQELVDVSGVPSELEHLPLQNKKRILGLAKLLFFVIYSPGERLPLVKVIQMEELPPCVRHLAPTEQARYRSSRTVENTAVRKELMSIIGGDSGAGNNGGAASSRASSVGARSTSSSGAKRSAPVTSRYLDSYLKQKAKRDEENAANPKQTNNNKRSAAANNKGTMSRVALLPPRRK